MKKIDIALAAGLALSIFLTSLTGFAKNCGEIRDESLRLHILANSDSAPDQALKLKVRDAILAQSPEIFSPARSKAQAEDLIRQELTRVEQTARAEILRGGFDYSVKAELVNMYFETRTYDGYTLPAGRYDAVRVRIGKAAGKNWWCVLFPPLCIPAASEKLPVEEQIKNLGEEPRYVPKLAVLELLDKVTGNHPAPQ